MPRLHVCALSRLPETVETSGARHVVTLINVGTPVTRPPSISETDHLFVGVSDITDALDGHVLPDEEHVRFVMLQQIRGNLAANAAEAAARLPQELAARERSRHRSQSVEGRVVHRGEFF